MVACGSGGGTVTTVQNQALATVYGVKPGDHIQIGGDSADIGSIISLTFAFAPIAGVTSYGPRHAAATTSR